MRIAKPPGPRTPALVNALSYTRDPLAFHPRLAERYGETFSVSFPDFRNLVYFSNPEHVRELFQGDPSVFHAGEAHGTVLEPAVGPGSVLVLDGREHMAQRKLLLPPFHGRAIDKYREVMREAVARDIATWPTGESFSLHPHMQSITLEVILRAVYGVRDAERFARASEVIAEFANLSDALMLPHWMRRPRVGPWKRFIRSRERMRALVYEEIELRRAEAAEERDDVLSLLLRATHDDGSPLTEEELCDELVTVVGAGHETTATALAWAMERLLRHPDALARLRESFEAGESDYADAVVKETLRVRPVIVDTARLVKAPISIGGYDIEPGTMVLASITAMHAREDIYPDALAFRPERFAGESPGTYTWLPFGGGVRRCLGAAFAQEEMRVVLREIVMRADLRAADAAPERPRMRHITVSPEHGTRVVLGAPLRDAVAEPVAEPTAVA